MKIIFPRLIKTNKKTSTTSTTPKLLLSKPTFTSTTAKAAAPTSRLLSSTTNLLLVPLLCFSLPAVTRSFSVVASIPSSPSSSISNSRSYSFSTSSSISSTSSRLSAASTSATSSTTSSLDNIMTDLDLETLASHANSYASANGIMVVSKSQETAGTVGKFECAPMSLLPNAYPRDRFQQAHDVAPYFNELVDRVSRDSTFLTEVLGGGVSDMDPFTAKLLKLYQKVYVDGPSDSPANQADRLGIHRSDYMLHKSSNDNDTNDEYQLKQVELNTIAASFAGLSCKISNLHTYLTSRFKHNVQSFLETNEKAVMSSSSSKSKSPTSTNHVHSFGVPHNPALTEIPTAINYAVNRYLDRHSSTITKNHRLVVLFVVQPNETNTVDQRLLEFALWEHHGIPVVRMSLEEASKSITVSKDTGALLIEKQDDNDGNAVVEEIAVVYYRAGYAPTDYPDGDNGVEWKARLMLEESRATKCPNLGYHLAGTKKVQQELARPGVLERFFPNQDDDVHKVAAMRACFAGLYSLGDDATSDDINVVKSIVVNKPDGGQEEALYVLKPQREGGGYNFYGQDLATKLRDNTTYDETTDTLTLGNTLAEYILMQRLFPPQQRAILLRGGKVEGSGESISELGCFGCLVVDADGNVKHNQYAGFLLRTKFSGVDEGGVASGFATLSSPYLC